MFAHQSALTSNNTSSGRYSKRGQVRHLLNGAELSARARNWTLAKTYANSELRLKWKRPHKAAANRAADGCFAAGGQPAEATLVYNGKLQHGLGSQPALKRRKPTMQLTPYGGHTLREACAVLEQKFGKNVYFNTLTLPGSTREVYDTAARESTGITNAYMQRIRHAIKTFCVSNGIESDGLYACGVWEWQERGALHFHLVVGIEHRKLAMYLKHNHRRWWRQVLETYSDSTGVDLFQREEGGSWRGDETKPVTEWAKVKTSVEAYVSKYVAKTARKAGLEGWIPPKKFWTLSTPLRREVMAARMQVGCHFETPEQAAEFAFDLAEICQAMGGTVLESRDEFTQQPCGFVIYPPKDKKDEFWRMSMMLMAAAGGGPEQQVPDLQEGMTEEDGMIVADDWVELMFEGKPLDTVAFGCADLCAPFSSQEKGGGMRYH